MKTQLQFLSEELNHRDNEYKEQKMAADRSELEIKQLRQELEKAFKNTPTLEGPEGVGDSFVEPSPKAGVSERMQDYIKGMKEAMAKMKNDNKELHECMDDMSSNLESANVVNSRMREQLVAAEKKIGTLKAKMQESKKNFQGIDRVLYSLLLIQRKEISEFRKNYSEVFRSSKEFQIFSLNERKLWKALREELAAEGKKKHKEDAHLARVTELAKQETLQE